MSGISNTGTRLEWALRYIKLGWPVFPLEGKIPLKGSNGSKDATLNEAQVREWWNRYPRANIGIATSHRFFVVDVDIKKGGEESFEFLVNQYGRFPDTIEQVTGSGGRHLLFALPDFPVLNSEGWIAPGIDIRGSGGYIVASNSIHPETKREYFWDGITEIEQQAVAAAPAWVLEKLKNQKNQPRPGTAPLAVPAEIVEGGRNAQLFKAACAMRRKGFSEEEIYATIRAVNIARCRPPLEEREVRGIAASSARYAPDRKASVFAGSGSAPPKENAAGDGGDELPITAADVEAAADEIIGRNSLIDAMRLAASVATLREMNRAVIIAKFRQHFGREFLLREFRNAMKDAAGDSGAPPEDPPPEGEAPAPGGPDLRGYPHTDSGNGERIVALFGSEIRYCVEMEKWLVWDGRRWAVDEMNVIHQKAKYMARLLYAQADGNSTLEKHARESESRGGIRAAIDCAATEKGIPISAADLDQHPLLLNCMNGVVDLKSGTLLPHNREFFITKLCPVAFDPKARCPRFQAFVEWSMGGNIDAELPERTVRLVGFLQRAFGYALTSDVGEKAIFVLHGEGGNNGKTTLLNTFRDLLGKDYSGQLVIDTVMSMKNQDATTRADLADLRGVRFVVTSEVEKEHRLNEGKIKYLTAGMGSIKSCRKYENPIEFTATHKLFMDCNHRPHVRGVDDAIWRRLKLVPFEITVTEEERDLQLPDKLRSELPGILAWAVRGCKAWLDNGLGDPPEISSAGALWREHDDPLKEFLEDCCDVDDPETTEENRSYVTVTDLGAAYEWWAKKNRERYPLGRESFNERMIAKKFIQKRGRRIAGKQARTWEGLELKSDIQEQVDRAPRFSGAMMRDD